MRSRHRLRIPVRPVYLSKLWFPTGSSASFPKIHSSNTIPTHILVLHSARLEQFCKASNLSWASRNHMCLRSLWGRSSGAVWSMLARCALESGRFRLICRPSCFAVRLPPNRHRLIVIGRRSYRWSRLMHFLWMVFWSVKITWLLPLLPWLNPSTLAPSQPKHRHLTLHLLEQTIPFSVPAQPHQLSSQK